MGPVIRSLRGRAVAAAAVVALLATACFAGEGGGAVPVPTRAAPATTAAPGVQTSPTYAAGVPVLASYSVSQLPGDQQLALSWRYATSGGAPKLMHLDLFQIVNGAPAKVASNIVGQTVEPDDYTIPVSTGAWVVRATPENSAGFGTGINSSIVNVANPCATAVLCARISPSASPSPITLAAQGMVHGGVVDTPVTQALELKQWRFAGSASDPTARGLGVSRTQVVSDLWIGATAPTNLGYARTPWSNWNAWQSFVQNTVRWIKATGSSPDYWEIWNEPNGMCCPRFSPQDLTTVTVGLWLQTYEMGWKAIKSVDPSAKIIGPSLSALQWAPGSPHEFDIDTFLAYSAAHGITWDALAWHEATVAPSPGDMFPVVTNVDRHIAMAKAVMARHPGVVANGTIVINEYGGKAVHVLPGWDVGYFRAIEDGGVREANRACWGDAECGTQLDGLVDAAGRVTGQWWAAKLYSGLAGGTRMNVVSTSSWQFDGLATRDDGTRTVKSLLGRHWSCNRSANSLCGDQYDVAPASISVSIDWPYGNSPVNIDITRVPAGTGALAVPVPVSSTVVQPVGGSVTVLVPTVADGDALSLVAHPA